MCSFLSEVHEALLIGFANAAQVRRQLHAFGTALLRARQAALLPGLLRLARPLAADPALQLLQVLRICGQVMAGLGQNACHLISAQSFKRLCLC